MPLKRYFYTGLQTAIALPPESEGGQPIEVPLIPYTEVKLPDDMEYVQRLVGKCLLSEVPEPEEDQSPAEDGAASAARRRTKE